jgi:DNA-binding IclR family transcriptional regulator
MLSTMNDEELQKLYASPRKFCKLTEKSVGTYPQLRLALQEVRKEGVARDFEECLIGVNCIASAIVNREGKAMAAVSISGPRERLTIPKMDDLKPLLLDTTEKISNEFRS